MCVREYCIQIGSPSAIQLQLASNLVAQWFKHPGSNPQLGHKLYQVGARKNDND
jgi:hypothetical protein